MERNEFVEQIKTQVAAWAGENAGSLPARSQLIRELADALWESLMEEAPDAYYLSAPNAVVEIIDEASGILYRRYLELEYEENDNGIRLMGEAVTGQEAQIAFLSETALKKMHDLRGAGPDKPRCDNH